MVQTCAKGSHGLIHAGTVKYICVPPLKGETLREPPCPNRTTLSYGTKPVPVSRICVPTRPEVGVRYESETLPYVPLPETVTVAVAVFCWPALLVTGKTTLYGPAG